MLRRRRAEGAYGVYRRLESDNEVPPPYEPGDDDDALISVDCDELPPAYDAPMSLSRSTPRYTGHAPVPAPAGRATEDSDSTDSDSADECEDPVLADPASHSIVQHNEL